MIYLSIPGQLNTLHQSVSYVERGDSQAIGFEVIPIYMMHKSLFRLLVCKHGDFIDCKK